MSKHEDAAREHMELATAAEKEGWSGTAWLHLQLAKLEMAFAQVDQQRVGNLIALDRDKRAEYGGYAGPSLLFGTPVSEFGNVPVRPEIAEALGLDHG